MEREVEDFIQNLPNIDLIEYTHNKMHLPDAIQFAKCELARRKLSPEQLASLDKELHERRKKREEKIREIASEPLPPKWRVAVFLSGLYFAFPLIFFVPAWLRFREQGSEQKCKDMCTFALVGLVIQPVFILLKIPPWSFLIKLFSK
jgi:hypothetical protein